MAEHRTAAWAVTARFPDPEALKRAIADIRRSETAGSITKLEAFSPHPLPELPGLWPSRSWLPKIIAGAAIGGAAFGFGMQYWYNVIDYPMNVGGRPLNSWPAFLPVTFELMVLSAALCAFVVLFGVLRLPRFHRPELEAAALTRVTIDSFALKICCGSRVDAVALGRELARMGGLDVEVRP